MFNHDVLNFRVEKFNLQDVPTDIGVGLRRVDTGQTQLLYLIATNLYNILILWRTLHSQSICQALI